jgi:hypothetical protein
MTRPEDVDPSDGRDESTNERMDRNWNELLQELRVTQTGTQILSGFLLTIAFQPTFGGLPQFDKTLYLVIVLLATFTTALALSPVHLHRTVFRHHDKPSLVQLSHLMLRSALAGLVVVITGTVLLVFDVATHDRRTAIAAAVGVAVVLVGLGLVPLLVRSDAIRRRLERQASAP